MKKIILLLSILASTAYAQQAVWINDNSLPGYQFARITNAEGSTAGYVCNIANKACDAYLFSGASCEEGELYPLMVNSPLGAYSMTAKCLTLGKYQLLIMVENKSAVEAFQSGGEIGFALPMASGAFKVFRFTTAGATAAIEAARTLPTKTPPRPKKTRSVETL